MLTSAKVNAIRIRSLAPPDYFHNLVELFFPKNIDDDIFMKILSVFFQIYNCQIVQSRDVEKNPLKIPRSRSMDADDFQNVINSSSYKDTSLVKCS